MQSTLLKAPGSGGSASVVAFLRAHCSSGPSSSSAAAAAASAGAAAAASKGGEDEEEEGEGEGGGDPEILRRRELIVKMLIWEKRAVRWYKQVRELTCNCSYHVWAFWWVGRCGCPAPPETASISMLIPPPQPNTPQQDAVAYIRALAQRLDAPAAAAPQQDNDPASRLPLPLLEAEAQALEDAMTKYPEGNVGGVPQVFLQYSATYGLSLDEDGLEVVVDDVADAKNGGGGGAEGKGGGGAGGDRRKSSSSSGAAAECIEILDDDD